MPSQLNSVSSFSIFGCLLRQPGMGSRKMIWMSTTHPEAPRMSQIFQLWARNWGHIRAACESSCLTWQLCREYAIEICFGERNPHLSVSVNSPPDAATFQILDEGGDPCCPWNISQMICGDINTFRQSYEWEHRHRNQGAEPRERSRVENSKGRRGGSQGKWRIHHKGHRGGESVTRCERETWKSVSCMSTMI